MSRYVSLACLLSSALSLAGCDSDPQALEVILTPADPTTGDTLVATVETADDSAFSGSAEFSWFQDGVERTDLESLALLPGFQTTRGEVWYVVAMVTRGEDDALPLQSNSAIIRNSAPSISQVTITPAAADSSTELLAEVIGWQDLDADEPVYTYSWSVDGGPAGADLPTLDPMYFVRGQEVVVEVTPSDGEDSGPPVQSEAVTIGNSPPTVPLVAVLPIHPIAGLDDLVCSILDDATDPDADPVSYALDWAVDGTAYPDGDSSAGWMGPTTTSTDGDTVPASDGAAEQEWLCTVTASDGTAAAAAVQRAVTLSEVDETASDFSLIDVNTLSATSGEPVSPRDYLCKVSGWYFGHST